MGCTQAKPSKPNQNQTASHQGQETSKAKQHPANLQTQQRQIQGNDGSSNKENSQSSKKQTVSKQQLAANPVENGSSIKPFRSGAEQVHDEQSQEQKSSLIQGSRGSRSNMKNINESKMPKKSLAQEEHQSQNSSAGNKLEQLQKSRQKFTDEKMAQSVHHKERNNSRNEVLEKSKDLKHQTQSIKQTQLIQLIDWTELGVESKVQQRPGNKENSQQNTLSKQKPNDNTVSKQRQPNTVSNQRLNQTTHLPQKNQLNESKQFNQSLTQSKKPFTHHLFYSQHQNKKQQTQPHPQKQQPQTKTNIVVKSNPKKQHPSYDDYFDQPQNPVDGKSIKSQVLGQSLDQSLVANANSPKNNMFAKNNQFYSVVQQRKEFNYNYQQIQEIEPPRIPSKKTIKQVNFQSAQKITNNDFLFDEGDQEGTARVPIETSCHAPSKRNIETESKKQYSVTSSKVAGNYLHSLQGKLASRAEQESSLKSRKSRKSFEDDERSSVRNGLQQSHKKQSKMDTAFFKQASQMNMESSQHQHSGSKQAQAKPSELKECQSQSFLHNSKKADFSKTETVLKQSISPKKKGPIMFSEISFRGDDSEVVPDEMRGSNGLQMSLHLNVSHEY